MGEEETFLDRMTSLIHSQSVQSIDSGLDLFSVPPTQTSVESGQYVEMYPLASLAPGAPMEFSVSGAGDDYVDFANTVVHIKAKVLNGDGTNLAVDTRVVPVTNFLHSLISQVDVSLNGVLISGSENTYGYRAQIETCLSYTQEAKDTFMTSTLLHRDTAGHMDDTQGQDNLGMAARRARSAESKTLDMLGKLHTDLGGCNRYLLPGVDIKIRLVPSKEAFHLVSQGAAVYKTVITHISLFLRRVRVNPAVYLAQEKALMRATAKYPVKRVVVKSFSIARGQSSQVIDNIFQSQLPKKLVIGIVKSSAFLGHKNQNPFNFEHHGLNYLAVTVDGKPVPSKPLTPDFENGQYVRSYWNQCLATGQVQANSGVGITYSDFARGFALYVLDLTPSVLDGDQVELLKSGSLRLELKFAAELAAPVHVLVYGVLDSMIEIDKSRQVIADFAT